MAPDERTERVTFRVSEAELAMLTDLSEASGLSTSDVLRQLLRAAHAEKFPARVPKKPKR